MRRVLLAALVVIIIGGLSWAGYQLTAAPKAEPTPDYEVYAVTRGDISASVTATGSIEPIAAVDLTFRAVGRVAEVKVQVGDSVEPGQVLAQLETTDLELAGRQAGVGLRLAEARLAQAARPPASEDLAAAEAAVESAQAALAAAQAAYQDLLKGPSASQRTVLQANQKRAEAMLASAQAAYDQIAYMPNAGMMPQAVQLQQATIDYEVAKANVASSLAPPTASQKASALAQIAQTQSAVAQAESALARLQRGLAAEDRVILEVQVEQAQIAVTQAELALQNATLTAPIAGVVGAVNIRPNEAPSPALPAITLADANGFQIKLNVDEIDIGALRVGQTALVTVDALNNVQLAGVVSRIAPVAASGLTSGVSVVTYEVTVDIDPSTEPLLAGMTATVAITTAEARNVVLLPNRVMRLDRQNNSTYVEKIVNGVPQRVEVTVGLRNEQFSEILAGVAEGDELAVRRTDTGDVIRQQFMGG